MLESILKPRAIAVIGASRHPGTIGHEVLASLVRQGFTGAVYPVNPKAAAIHSVPAWPSIAAVPGPVDLGVIIVPKEQVLDAIAECAEAGIAGVVVISSGFKEVGADGAERERQLVKLVRARGMRMVGPNCMGVLNADPTISMNATFYKGMPPFGRAAFMSQSGALGLSVLDYAREYGIGIAQFVSMGNKPDVSGNDLLLAWEDDPGVGVILMYVENFGNPRKFLEIASRVTRRKPIVVVKSGRSASGARAASSHTGALAASDTAVDALLAQAGVIRAASIEELFDLAMIFGGRTLPPSRRTAVLTNAGGPGILAADALEASGMQLPDLAPATVERLKPLFPPYASIRNPLDMVASATPEGYRAALGALLDDPAVDVVVPIFVPPLGLAQEEVAGVIADVAKGYEHKALAAVLMGHDGLPEGRADLHATGIPAFIFPESAARALAGASRFRERQLRHEPVTEGASVDREGARRLLEAAAATGRRKLTEAEAMRLLACYGIPLAPWSVAESPADARRAADALAYPVVVKAISPAIIHKSEFGAVRVGLANGDAVESAVIEMQEAVARRAPDAVIEGFLLQRQVAGGREFVAGVTRDHSFGPLVMFGLGGIYVEALRDVVFRLAPIGRVDAMEMLDGIRGSALLGPIRGEPAVDREALADVLVRLSRLASDCHSIQEIDMNPLLPDDRGVVAVDARVLLVEGS